MADTPRSLGLQVDDLWEPLNLRHTILGWGGGEELSSSEAVVIVENPEMGVFFVPEALLDAAAPRVQLAAQDDNGTDISAAVTGGYLVLASGDYVLNVASGPATTVFSDVGYSPSLGQVALEVPFSVLPEDIADLLTRSTLTSDPVRATGTPDPDVRAEGPTTAPE